MTGLEYGTGISKNVGGISDSAPASISQLEGISPDGSLRLWHQYDIERSLSSRIGPSAVVVRNGLAGMDFNSSAVLVHDRHQRLLNTDTPLADYVFSRLTESDAGTAFGSPAVTIVETTDDNTHYVDIDDVAVTAADDGRSYILSYYVRSNHVSARYIGFRWDYDASSQHTFFDLQEEVVTLTAASHSNPTITSIQFNGETWYRLSVQISPLASFASSTVRIATSGNGTTSSFVGVTTASFTFAGYILSEGIQLFDYLENPSNSNVKFDQPVFPYSIAGVSRGLRMVGGYTQLCLSTQLFENTDDWTSPNTTFTAGKLAPDGTTTAIDVKHTSSTSGSLQNITVVDGGDLCASCFFHEGDTGEHDWVRILVVDAATSINGFRAWFNLQTGAMGSANSFGSGTSFTAAGFIEEGGGYYRLWVSGKLAAGTTAGRGQIGNVVADNSSTEEDTNSAWWWGYDLTPTTFPMPYMPGTTAAVVRPAETCITDITGLLPNDEVTIEISGRTPLGLDGDQVFLQLDAGDEDDRFRLFRDSSGDMHFIVTETTTEVADLDLGAVANDTDFLAIVSAKAGRFVGAVEGNTAGTPDTGGDFPTGVDTQRTGHDVTGSHCQSTIASVKLYNAFDEAAVDAIAA